MTSNRVVAAIVLLINLTGCESPSQNPEVRLERAILLQERGEFEAAILAYTKLESELKELPDLFHNRGYCYEQLQLTEKAVQNYRLCLERQPNHISALNNLAAILARQQEFKESVSLFSRILELDADNVLALRNRGLCHFEAGRPEQALQDYDRVLQLDPIDPQALFQRGNVHSRSGRLPSAVNDYTAAVTSSPRFAQAWLNRGLALHQLGDIDGARRDLRQARDLDKNIILAGIEWLEDASEQEPQEVTLQLDVEPVPVPSWEATLNFAVQQLHERGYRQLQIDAALPDQLSAVLTADLQGVEYQVWVCLKRATVVTFPAVPPARHCALMILGPPSNKGAGPAVLDYRDPWEPSEAVIAPQTIEVDLAREESPPQLIPQLLDE